MDRDSVARVAEKLWAFNRRTVEDQVVYIRAASLCEARSKLLVGDAHDTNDADIRSVKYRRLADQDREQSK